MEDLIEKVKQFLGDGELFEHSVAVAKIAEALAEKYGENTSKAFSAGILHDVGGIYPADKQMAIAAEAGIVLLPEEEAYPVLLHQKISKFLARWKFGFFNDEILSAIECHTTLKAHFTQLDLIVFLADKLSWENAAYHTGMKEALRNSPGASALFYMNFMLEKGMPVVHPWFLEGKAALEEKLNTKKGE